jgi:2-dehydropantoate 2-reductase
LQNGVEHVERFSSFLSVDRIVPVIVECPAERTAPGKISQRRGAWMKVPDSPLGRAFCHLFNGTQIDVQITPDFVTAAWTKLCLNCAGAVSAVTLKPNGVVHIPQIADLMRSLIRECIAVGNTQGASLPDSLVETIIEGCRDAPRDGINSLYADRLAGRPMEIDARNGVIVRLGSRHGIPTPANQLVVALLTAAQESPAHSRECPSNL